MPMQDCAAEQTRSEARRAQILAAAGDCFRRHGFHGASIAQISKEAGMSPGHIYHYFENKEAIIAAIVEQDLARVLGLISELRSASDLLQALVDRAAQGVEENLEPHRVGLNLEIIAEAARNERVADIVRSADRQCRAGLADTLRTLRRSRGEADDDSEVRGMAELIATLFEGLRVRSIRNPELDRELVVRMFRRVLTDLLGGKSR